MATMNPVDLYHDPALDSLIAQNTARNRQSGSGRRNSGGQGRRPLSQNLENTLQPLPAAPEVPRGPPISYRGLGQGGDPGLQRSFSQRAKGRPFHREAFEDLEDEYPEEAAKPKQRIVSEPVRREPMPSVSRKPAPPDGLRLNTADLNGLSAADPPGRNTESTRKPSYNEPKSDQKARRTSETSRRVEEPVSSVSRSSALRDEAHRRDWAPDRSPLQKLEVTLNDISKEEKRARVQEAEMLLREREPKPARKAVGAPRGTGVVSIPDASTTRSAPKRERATDQEVPTLEDAVLVRNLSTTQRQRLQHSTTVDSHRPDVRSLSGEGHPAFEYTISSPLQPANTSQRRQSGSKNRRVSEPAQEGPLDSPRVASEEVPIKSERVRSGKQRETQQVGAEVEPLGGQARARTIDTQTAPLARRDDFSERQRNASHKAALEKLTGVSDPVRFGRGGSQRLQKAPPKDVDEKISSAGRTPSRIPVPTTTTATPARRQEQHNQGAADLRNDISQMQQQPQTPPIIGLGHQSSPHPSSPQSPPAKPVDVIRQRQRKSSVSFKEPLNNRPVDEWKEAGTARLTTIDFSPEPLNPADRGKAWWEQTAASSSRRRSRSAKVADQPAGDYIDDKTAEFKPNLYLRCGPLLRYKGMRRQKNESGEEREFWRGSVLIVTQNSHSSYDPAPILRLFCKPQKLLPPPPHHVTTDELQPEYVDPIAGLTKLSRTGRALYVRPVDHLEEGKDLSQVENDDGLFESSPSPLEHNGPQGLVPFSNNRNLDTDGEKIGRYQEVAGARLYADPDRDVTFWRFNLEIELANEQQHIAYRINRGPSVGFWVPGRGQTMHIMFHSCNGFSLSVNPDSFSGPDPMWRDVLNTHQSHPFHVMIGGGDQIYNDRVMLETEHFGEWTRMRNPAHKHHAPFTHEMKEELESFYLNRYALWFSQGLFSMAAGQIPMVNIWDDHDIIDGFGSYPNHFMETPVFSGLGNVAFKYYMLFQHQSVPEETTAHEPSWVLGRQPGPYIKQLSRSVFMHMGKHVAFLGLDCRTERKRSEVLSFDTLDFVLDRCRKELVEGETKHLIILMGVPLAYPRLVWLENVLTSRLMDPVKALGRAGILKGSFLNKFDGGVEILDDLDDHWTATNHKHERNDLVRDLQDLAAEKSCRITVLSGDVHLAAIGQFHSNPKLKIPKDKDHRYMPNVVSSAIVNTPPSDMLADILNKRNKVHHLDHYTDEDMIPMFTHDVNDKKRNNKRLLPRRNWCSIQEYIPGSTPPPSPSESSAVFEDEDFEESPEARPRRFSFTKADVNPRALIRRLSSRKAPPTSYRDAIYDQGRSASHDGTTRSEGPTLAQDRNASGSRQASSEFQALPSRRASSFDHTSGGVPVRPGTFKRRPTNFSEKAARKGNVPAIDAEGNEIDVNDHVNLEGGLDVVLNVEVNQKDPSGITVPYRLLVPALWYDGSSDREKLDEASGMQRKPTLLNRFGIGRRMPKAPGNQEEEWGQDESDEDYAEDSYAPRAGAAPRRRFSLFGSRRQRREDYPSDDEDDTEDQPQVQANGTGQSQQYRPENNTRGHHPVSQPRNAEYQMVHNMTSPPSHDMLYDTDNRPPASHSLEPGVHSSVRRSLTISGRGIQTRGGEMPVGSTGGNHSGQQLSSVQAVERGQPHVAPSSAAFATNPHGAPDRPQRRLSKQERVLGILPSEPQPYGIPQKLRGNGVIGRDFRQSYDQGDEFEAPPRKGYSGTWQSILNTSDPSHPTNIARFARAISPVALVKGQDGVEREVEQIIYYQPGVGTGIGDRIRGGVYGAGLSANIRAAYAFLAHNYDPNPGDEIFFFGFSRGAYTARSIAGLVTKLGLLTKRGMDWFPQVYEEYYKDPSSKPDFDFSPTLKKLIGKDLNENAKEAIKIVGVWDTVAFHGQGLGGEKIEFHNAELSTKVQFAYHALALDERRIPFIPTLWQWPKDPSNGSQLYRPKKGSGLQVMKQVWFSGVHSDIGGGMDDPRGADITLAWMLAQCSKDKKLAFIDEDPEHPDDPNEYYLLADRLKPNPNETWSQLDGELAPKPGTGIIGAIKDKFGEIIMDDREAWPMENTFERIHRSIHDRNFDNWPCGMLKGEAQGGLWALASPSKYGKALQELERDEVADAIEDKYRGRVRAAPGLKGGPAIPKL
ncbi:hypothetical protein AYO21_00366 [Fonsecaea monophora]|uniref:DUF2235 domain-containing protein n=1 Tax=Fonsecaea monophora TaxID=254056 RepID=A0A177FQG6_9EURO|nr:hypothetical protein AYO21_00366 [Fonsecaea monophora]OAG45730.1 hypothetical protein AYO21_00366 [Fonsecaea monophora]